MFNIIIIMYLFIFRTAVFFVFLQLDLTYSGCIVSFPWMTKLFLPRHKPC